MKQRVTDKQLAQLKPNQQESYHNWCTEKGYEPIPDIGQMIELIQDKKPDFKGISKNRFSKWFVNIETAQLGYKDEMCDALWEAVTRIL